SAEAITTMGGLRIKPDMLLDELDPTESELLVLGGSEMWGRGGGQPFGASAEYLAVTGYAGGSRYVDERAVVDGDLITAGPQSPVQFARAVLERLGLADERTLAAYEALFADGDAS